VTDKISEFMEAQTFSSGKRKEAPLRVVKGKKRAAEGEHLPQKKYFRQRAHINPLGSAHVYTYPISPDRMTWKAMFPALEDSHTSASSSEVTHDAEPFATAPDVADVGCGFGGLVVGLAPVLPRHLLLGMEIRPKVTEYVRLRILALRKQHEAAIAAGKIAGSVALKVDESFIPTDEVNEEEKRRQLSFHYKNASVLKINAMKYLPNFFAKGQLRKLFFCFPDPQFKPSHHRRRIVNTQLLDEYAYAIREGGRLYTITDVRDLHNWMKAHADAHPSFSRLTDAELASDPSVAVMLVATEEGRKVARNHGKKYIAVYRRVTTDEANKKADLHDFWTEPPVDYVYEPAPAQKRHKERLEKALLAAKDS